MTSFTDNLLFELREMPDSLNVLLDRLKQEDYICIWGTGIAGQMIYSKLKKEGIKPKSFINSTRKQLSDRCFDGLPILIPDKIPSNAFIIIACDIKYEIHRLIREKHENEYCYIDPHLLVQHSDSTKKQVMESFENSKAEIDTVYSELQDERSKITFRNVLIHRTVHRIELLWDVLEQKQYFGNDVIHSADGSFIDCGAYTGDTLKEFMRQLSGKNYFYHAFEPEHINFLALQDYVEKNQIQNVCLYNTGLWDTVTTLHLLQNDTNDTLAWKFDDRNHDSMPGISVDTLDHILSDIRPDLIKMDIEGAELKALDGARNTLQRSCPKLAISAYHELNHLWQVPLKMKELNPGYRLFFRHHSWNMADTVCYGI